MKQKELLWKCIDEFIKPSKADSQPNSVHFYLVPATKMWLVGLLMCLAAIATAKEESVMVRKKMRSNQKQKLN